MELWSFFEAGPVSPLQSGGAHVRMTAVERDSWFNTGTMVALVFASLVWKGPNLKVRAIHAAILFGAFLIVRAAYTHFTRPKPHGATPESNE